MDAKALTIFVAASLAIAAACGGRIERENVAPSEDASASDASIVAIDSGNPFAAVCDGGPAADPARTCSVSFENDIMPRMASGGEWGCAASQCHDVMKGVPPIVDSDDVAGTWWHFVLIDVDELPYVNPCTKDGSASSILGNLGTPTTHGPHMPLGNASVPTQSEVETILAPWVECGSPLN